MGDSPQHPGYEEMKDTPWITQGRQIADIGGQGILSNYGKVNVFDEATKASLNARNNEIYNRAFGDARDAYMNTMNKYAGANYNRFGTLNATPSAYITDQYRKDMQRQMDNLSYEKAMNYENLVNNELQRRYNTLNMFGNMYQYGRTPYDLDLQNWNIRNTNRDINYQNALASSQNSFGNQFGQIAGGLIGTGIGSLAGGFGGALGSSLGKNIGGMIGGSI